MPLARELLDVLVCPASKAPLVYFPRGERDDDELHGFLLCPASRRRYAIDGGIPVMLIDEAAPLAEAEVARLVARATALGLPLR